MYAPFLLKEAQLQKKSLRGICSIILPAAEQMLLLKNNNNKATARCQGSQRRDDTRRKNAAPSRGKEMAK
jgi:hypothetical protein